MGIIKTIFILSMIYIIAIFLVKYVNIENINIKNKNKLIDFEKEYKLPKKNLRGRNLTKLEK
jgi:hypothetical protein